MSTLIVCVSWTVHGCSEILLNRLIRGVENVPAHAENRDDNVLKFLSTRFELWFVFIRGGEVFRAIFGNVIKSD